MTDVLKADDVNAATDKAKESGAFDANATNTTEAKTKGDLFTSFNVGDFAVPRGRDEDWRFTPLRRLNGLHDGSFVHEKEPSPVTVVIPDGTTGVRVEHVPADDDRLRSAGAPVDRVGAQVFSSLRRGTVLTIDAGTIVDENITLTFTGTGPDTTSFGAVAILVGAHAEANLVLRFEGHGNYADFHGYSLGAGAHLNVAIIDDMGDDAVHLANERIRLDRDAVVRHGYSAFGGSVVRNICHAVFTAPGGDCELSGVYFADDGQYFEQRLLVDHAEANCRSNVMYKGALQGNPSSDRPETRAAWVGDVLIRAQADNTDTYEKSMNLVLSEGARADAVPNLEIATGEIIGAGHAATVGRFDDEQLYYLMSRGIPKPVARRLIVHGFFTEVISQIPIAAVREELEKRVADELDSVKLDELNSPS
ncbi:SufD family Fe-S cluster assembly protein [Corynebacterium kroppenstedtii]|uniref:SufB/SufD family protein n=1 Tax=Corynebacterium sp. PCR 32 TaxID=3351342 RepID=UPI0030A710C5